MGALRECIRKYPLPDCDDKSVGDLMRRRMQCVNDKLGKNM